MHPNMASDRRKEGSTATHRLQGRTLRHKRLSRFWVSVSRVQFSMNILFPLLVQLFSFLFLVLLVHLLLTWSPQRLKVSDLGCVLGFFNPGFWVAGLRMNS